MSDLIDRQAAIDAIDKMLPANPMHSKYTQGIACGASLAREFIKELPSADVVERKRGKWEEKEVIHKEEAKDIIEEWQSCRCSVCERYDTRPYMYYFDKPNFCSWCGADMRERREDG